MTFYIVGAVAAAGIGAIIIHEHNDDDDRPGGIGQAGDASGIQ